MRSDPHSYTDTAQGSVRHLELVLRVDFPRRVLEGHCVVHLNDAASGPIDLDTRGLVVTSVVDGEGRTLAWSFDCDDAILGQRLRVQRSHPTARVRIDYCTSPDATALMWLEPEQTSSGRPFVLTQCQAIHARSVVPTQDSPQVRQTYEATLHLPAGMSAVMSAAPGHIEDTSDGVTATFRMPQPIAPYLFALAVGVLESRDLGPRTRVFAEPSVVDAAAWEFASAEAMLTTAEALFGPYPWERYDFIVLPASFPMGGMENPRMTFLTPTLIAGDRSLVNVLAHELAHSWTGNLVTNATNEDFWLNEGWTVYAERRILEVLEGQEVAEQAAALARVRLDAVIASRHAAGQRTALTYPQEGLDPDGEFSVVPYEKGFLLLTAIERGVGRERFDRFIASYIERFAFKVLTTDEFVRFLEGELPDHGVHLSRWLHDDGLPADAPAFLSPRLELLARQAEDWAEGGRPEPRTVSETLYTIAQLPVLSPEDATAAAEHLQLTNTGNAELRSAWLATAIRAGVVDEAEMEAFVGTVGRTKLLTPIFSALIASNSRSSAENLLSKNRGRWHISTRQAVQSLVSGSR